MMRFKKGTKVEVLSKSSDPSGAWRSAKIISGNGHYYTVMYDGEDVTERVPRKSMRPEPPLLQLLDSWAPGDILEVFDGCSWKMAIVFKVLDKGSCFLVRFLGSSLNFKVTKSDIRVRQSWQDNKWIMMGKPMLRLSEQTSNGELKRKKNLKGDYISPESKDKVEGSDALLSKKRTYYLVEPHNQTRALAAYPPGEEDRESVASSVGSCNMDMNSISPVSFSPLRTGNTSDTESSTCGYRKIKKLKISRKGSEAADIHKLELDVYRCNIQKLHASGPNLTWEQETWLTNLRHRLNISNEEHILQIRNLMSDDNSTTYREQQQHH